jgi:hypothetical protein
VNIGVRELARATRLAAGVAMLVTKLSGCASVSTQLAPPTGSHSVSAEFLAVANVISKELEKPFREFEFGATELTGIPGNITNLSLKMHMVSWRYVLPTTKRT